VPAVRFCSACGAALPSRPPVTCAACGASHYANPKPGANAIVVHEGRVLLVRRAHAPWEGAWCGPGGFSERREHPIETVERETFEETGERIEAREHLGTWVDEYADEPGDPDAETIAVSYYLAAPVGARGGDSDPREVSEVAWFAWEELPEPLAPPGTLQQVLAVARAVLAGRRTPLPDRPR
jgi:ADP-ribose pyrophosphatase YjhB (NUDIX family)